MERYGIFLAFGAAFPLPGLDAHTKSTTGAYLQGSPRDLLARETSCGGIVIAFPLQKTLDDHHLLLAEESVLFAPKGCDMVPVGEQKEGRWREMLASYARKWDLDLIGDFQLHLVNFYALSSR